VVSQSEAPAADRALRHHDLAAWTLRRLARERRVAEEFLLCRLVARVLGHGQSAGSFARIASGIGIVACFS
jgi:ABC-type phosphate/phosphonate transport system permease subunit